MLKKENIATNEKLRKVIEDIELLSAKEQAQICAEGCEEDNITYFCWG